MSKKLLTKILKLKQLYEDGDIPTLVQHEVHPELEASSRERYLYFTLSVCLNFQRSSPAMRKAAHATYHDPETMYLFFPEKVIGKTYEQVQKDLGKHKLALQKNKHTYIWYTICTTLYEHYQSDPRNLLSTAKHDVLEVHCLFQENKKSFPYLNGPKMSHYWLYILTQYTDVKFENMQHISIIPDTHVQQASKVLGVVDDGASIDNVVKKRFELLKDSSVTPVEMHPVLWNWSRNNFQPNV